MTKLISSDHPLSIQQQEKLTLLLDTLIPPSDDGQMPGAAELDFVSWLTQNAEEYLVELSRVLDCLDDQFPQYDEEQQIEAVTTLSTLEPNLFNALIAQVYSCYYEDDRVLLGIGSAAGAPFPRGNTVESGDLSLLDPVNQLGRRYRNADVDAK